MKTVSQYNNNELLSITDEEVNKMVDFQCALDGIPLLPVQPEPPKKLVIEPDTTVYTVSGFVFKEKDSADAVIKVINEQVMCKVDYDYSIGYDFKYIEMSTDAAATMETTKHMSLNQYDGYKSDLSKYASEKTTFDKLNKIYQKIVNQRSGISDNIWQIITEARAERDKKLSVLKIFETYVTMAEGDKKLANKFFADAYPDDVHFLVPSDVEG